MPKAPQFHIRVLAGLRQVMAEGEPRKRRNAEKTWKKVVATGVARGWNDAEGNPL